MKLFATIALSVSAFAGFAMADQANILDEFETIDDVVTGLPRIVSNVESGQLSPVDLVIIQNSAALIGSLRTTVGVTGYDTSLDFRNSYWTKFDETFSRYYLNPNDVDATEKHQFGQIDLQSRDEFLKYFGESFEKNKADWVELMKRSGVVDEADQARALASVAYFAALSQRNLGAASPEDFVQLFPTYIWPWCQIPPP